MSMEKHRCKLCPRVFSNGRALGGHMRSHLATLPPATPKKKTEHPPIQLGDRTESDSSSTQSENDHISPKEENPVGYYGLRENPKKSVRASDPEFLDAGSVVQDRESETESTQCLTRRRSTKRPTQTQRATGCHSNGFEPKKLKPGGVKSESPTESTPVSSVSDPSQDEEVALCLMMLSRDVWVEENDSAELKKKKKTRSTRTAGFKCLSCKKKFRTNKALVGHKASSKDCQNQETYDEDHKIYECPFCYKVFGSGQALGGHKRSHLLGSSTNTNLPPNHDVDVDANNNDASNVVVDKVGSFILDLNLPAPVEDYEDS